MKRKEVIYRRMKIKVKNAFLDILHVLFLGVFIGLVIALFSFVFELLAEISLQMHASREPYVIVAQVFITVVAALLAYRLIREEPIVEGIAIPHALMAIRGEENIGGLHRIAALTASSLLTSVTAIPLGPEGVGGLLSAQVVVLGQKITKRNIGNRGEIAMGLSAGFGAAFLSPLAGLFYGFEEGWHHFSWKLLGKGILMCLSSYVVAYAIETAAGMKRIFALEGLIFPEWSSFLILPILFAAIPLVVYLFSYLFIVLNRYVRLRRDGKYARYRMLLFFVVVMIMGFFFPYDSVIGSGHSLIEHTLEESLWYIVLLYLFIRFFITLIGGNSGASGGIVIPSLAMGALIGRLFTLIMENYLHMDPSSSPFWIVFSSCFFLAVLNKVPLTASTLLASSLFFVTSNGVDALLAFLISLPLYAIACLPLYLHKIEDLYDGVIEVEEEAQHLPHLHGVPLEK